jgi:hypothetical protein
VNFLVIVLASQLLYYLLIAQTGVVGAFDSHIHDLYTLPIGGLIGSLISAYWRHSNIRMELCILFGVQVVISWFYPDYSLRMLFLLGFVVGYTTPLLLYIFRSQSTFQLALGLAISYAVGTALYTYPFIERGNIAIVLPLISVVALRYSHANHMYDREKSSFHWEVLAVMMLWIFADSALFETLSRSGTMDIWRTYPWIIIPTHLLGIFLAYRYGDEFMRQTRVIWSLFILSYILYWIKEPILLSVVYPIVISYYNVLLFKALIRLADIRLIALSMIGVGWIASSIANGIAIEHRLWIAASVLGIFGIIYPIYYRRVS